METSEATKADIFNILKAMTATTRNETIAVMTPAYAAPIMNIVFETMSSTEIATATESIISRPAVSRVDILKNMSPVARKKLLATMTVSQRKETLLKMTPANRIVALEAMTTTNRIATLLNMDNADKITAIESFSPAIRIDTLKTMTDTDRATILLTISAANRKTALETMTVTKRIQTIKAMNESDRSNVLIELSSAKRVETITNMDDTEKVTTIKAILEVLSPDKKAEILLELEKPFQLRILTSLDATKRAEIIIEMPTDQLAESILSFTDEDQKLTLKEMAPIHIARALEAMNETNRNNIILSMDADDRIAVIAQLSPDSEDAAYDAISTAQALQGSAINDAAVAAAKAQAKALLASKGITVPGI